MLNRQPLYWIGIALLVLGVALAVLFVATLYTPPLRIIEVVPAPVIVTVPACDMDTYVDDDGSTAQALRMRMVAGIALTRCDVIQFDSLVELAERWEREADRATQLESWLTECNWGLFEYQECETFKHAEHYDALHGAILDALNDCEYACDL